MSRSQASRPTETIRDRLLDTALRRFRAEGFDSVPVSVITREAGVAKGTFFNHFPTKDHVLAESFHRTIEEALADPSVHRAAAGEAIVAFTRALMERLARDPALGAALGPRMGSLPSARPGQPTGEGRVQAWLRDRLGEALPLRVPLVEPDPGRLSSLLVWAIRGTLEEWARGAGTTTTPAPEAVARVSYLLEAFGFPI